MHESTISRVTTQKYLHSLAVYLSKYFFSSHVNTEGGGEASSTAIRALVKKLDDAAENPAKPLSDSKVNHHAVRPWYYGGTSYCCEVSRVLSISAAQPA